MTFASLLHEEKTRQRSHQSPGEQPINHCLRSTPKNAEVTRNSRTRGITARKHVTDVSVLLVVNSPAMEAAILLQERVATAWTEMFPAEKPVTLASLHYSFCGSGDFAQAQVWARRCGLLFRRNSCVWLHVCLCVRSINISTLPSSRCLYDTPTLLSSCLFLYLPDCFIKSAF